LAHETRPAWPAARASKDHIIAEAFGAAFFVDFLVAFLVVFFADAFLVAFLVAFLAPPFFVALPALFFAIVSVL
jgi:hypothetical protein